MLTALEIVTFGAAFTLPAMGLVVLLVVASASSTTSIGSVTIGSTVLVEAAFLFNGDVLSISVNLVFPVAGSRRLLPGDAQSSNLSQQDLTVHRVFRESAKALNHTS